MTNTRCGAVCLNRTSMIAKTANTLKKTPSTCRAPKPSKTFEVYLWNISTIGSFASSFDAFTCENSGVSKSWRRIHMPTKTSTNEIRKQVRQPHDIKLSFDMTVESSATVPAERRMPNDNPICGMLV